MRYHRHPLPFVMLFALSAGTAVRGEEAKPAIPDDVKTSIQARIDAGQTAGIVVGLVGPGGETFHSAGVRQVGRPEPVDPDTIFEIGSITKSFTGILLADMARRGEVKLDDPVRKYLPKSVKLPKDEEREITLLDLATHQSGLPRLAGNMNPADPDDPFSDYTAEQLYAYLADAKLRHPIGAGYENSNLGIGLLGHALSLAAKTDYNTLVRRRVATPLGMTITSTQIDRAAAPRAAQGYEEAGGKLVPAKPWAWRTSSVLTGMGGLHSSAGEMLRFLAANVGITTSKLSPALMDAQSKRAEGSSEKMELGLAWQRTTSADQVIVWQNGATGGFHAYCGFDPKTKTGVVVLSNSSADIDDIGVHLLDPTSPLHEAQQIVPVDEATLARLDGWYDLGASKVRVTHEGTQLFAQYSGQGRYPVFPLSSTVFAYRVVHATLEFEVKQDGTVTQLTLHQSGRHLPAKRMSPENAPKEPVEIQVDPKILAEYVGRYELSPESTLEVKMKDGHLSCQLTGQQFFDAYAESEKDFFFKLVNARLTFERNAEGKVDALTLHEGGQDQKALRKN